MKSLPFRWFVLLAILLQINLYLNAATEKNVQAKTTDSDPIRYIKFSTNVSATTPTIELREIMVYANGENVAFSKSVNADSYGSDTYTSKVVDEDCTTGWTSNTYSSIIGGNGVGPTSANPHYIIVDLGMVYNIDRLKLVLASFLYTFDFFVSQDAINWSLVDSKTSTNGTFTYTSLPTQSIRYIKYACYYSSDWGQVNVQEIQAYSNNVNVALNKSVYANSYEWGDANSNGKSAVDGNNNTRWSSNRNDHVAEDAPDSVQVNVTLDLGSEQIVDSLALKYNTSNIFTLSTSADGNNWTQIDQRLNTDNNYSYVLRNTIGISHIIKSYTESSAICRVNISSDGGSPITARGICWSTSPQPTIANNTASNGTGTGSYTAELSNLVPNTIYYIRAYAINSEETKYSKEQTILYGLQVQTDVITLTNSTTATSGGYIQAVNGIEVLSRGVCWNNAHNPTVANSHTSDGSGTGEFISTISGLTAGTKYYARAYTTTSAGTFYGEEYPIISFPKKYVTNSDGFYPNEIFVESGTCNDMPYFYSNNGNELFYDGYYWHLAGWITSEDSGNPPLTGWWDGTILTLIDSQTPSLSYDKLTVKESSFNNGTFREQLTITHDNVNNEIFTGINTEDFVETGKAIVRNLPAGLTAKLVRNSNLELVFSLSGSATEHATANNLSNVKIMLLPAAFTDGKYKVTKGNLQQISLSFIDPTNVYITDTKNSSDYSLTENNNVLVQANSVLSINNTTDINQLIIYPGAKVNVSSGTTLNDVILKADDSNSFSLKLGTCMTINGTLTFEKTMLDSKWYFLSFPCDVNVADITMSGGGILDSDFYILTYDGANRAINGLGSNWSHVTGGTLAAKKGYAFGLRTGIGTQTLSFVLNKSIAECENESTVPATFYDGSLGNNHKGWNLIGQPYLCNFSGCDVGLNFLTTWNGSTYVGRANSLVSCIQPFEAFFVQVPNSAPISFSLTGRQSVRSVVVKDIQESMQLKIKSTEGEDISTFVFDNEQSAGYQIGQDLEKWISVESNKPQIYSLLNGVKYTHNALPLTYASNLTIAYYSKNAGTFTISADNIAVADLKALILLDSQTGTSTDLMQESYRFEAVAGTIENRFQLIAQRISTGDTQNVESDKPVVFVQNSILKIHYLPSNSVIQITDISGKILESNNVSDDNFEFTLKNAGIYTIQIVSNKGNWIYKTSNN